MYKIIKFILIVAAIICGIKAILSIVDGACYDHHGLSEIALMWLKSLVIGFLLVFLFIISYTDIFS